MGNPSAATRSISSSRSRVNLPTFTRESLRWASHFRMAAGVHAKTLAASSTVTSCIMVRFLRFGHPLEHSRDGGQWAGQAYVESAVGRAT
jgi:hypothetical protein